MLELANCSTEQIAEYNRCSENEEVTMTGDDMCENVKMFSHCWPECFCEHPLGYELLTEALEPHCAETPPCGAPAPAAPDLATPESPACAPRARAFAVCIAAAVSLAARTG
jgi:hypothetical protein